MEIKNDKTLHQRLQQIQARISTSTPSGAQCPSLIAVSKGQSAERIRELYQLGQRRFGENYVQELLDKAERLRDCAIEWVYIGHLQSNKIRKLVSVVNEIQTVSSFRHAELIARSALELDRAPFRIFLEVNAGEEASKTGLSLDSVQKIASEIESLLPALSLQGIMAIPPSIYQDSNYLNPPPLYQQLRKLANKIGLGQLSLGMSGDLRIAVETGSNVLRIGQALMGPRST